MGRLSAAEAEIRARARSARASREQDPSAHALAQSVYLEAVEWSAQGGPQAMAGVTVAARLVAPAICLEKGIDLTEENATAVAAYLVSEFLLTASRVTPEAVRAYALERSITGVTA